METQADTRKISPKKLLDGVIFFSLVAFVLCALGLMLWVLLISADSIEAKLVQQTQVGTVVLDATPFDYSCYTIVLTESGQYELEEYYNSSTFMQCMLLEEGDEVLITGSTDDRFWNIATG